MGPGEISDLGRDGGLQFPNQAELYEWCDDLGGEFRVEGAGSFHRNSPPYLMATEHPWWHLAGRSPHGEAAVCIAGSGDVPLFLLQAGAEPVVAVDVSRSACFLNELKRAALRRLPYEDYVVFFLSGLPRASGFLHARRLPQRMPAVERAALYDGLRQDLSAPARVFWDDRCRSTAPSESSPFQGFLHTLDLFTLEEIPCLSDPSHYTAWSAGARDYPILNLPMDLALRRLDMLFNMVYVSNVPEYMKMHFLAEENPEGYRTWLESFLRVVLKKLAPGGRFCSYFFQSGDAPSLTADLADFALLEDCGMRLDVRRIEYASAALGSRFRNVLAVWEKTRWD